MTEDPVGYNHTVLRLVLLNNRRHLGMLTGKIGKVIVSVFWSLGFSSTLDAYISSSNEPTVASIVVGI